MVLSTGNEFQPYLKLFVSWCETLCFTTGNHSFHTEKQSVSRHETNTGPWGGGLVPYATELHAGFDTDIG